MECSQVACTHFGHVAMTVPRSTTRRHYQKGPQSRGLTVSKGHCLEGSLPRNVRACKGGPHSRSPRGSQSPAGLQRAESIPHPPQPQEFWAAGVRKRRSWAGRRTRASRRSFPTPDSEFKEGPALPVFPLIGWRRGRPALIGWAGRGHDWCRLIAPPTCLRHYPACRAALPLRPLMFWRIQDGGAGVGCSAVHDPEGAGVPDPQGGPAGGATAPAGAGGRGEEGRGLGPGGVRGPGSWGLGGSGGFAGVQGWVPRGRWGLWVWGCTGQGRRGPVPGAWGSVGWLPGSGGLRVWGLRGRVCEVWGVGLPGGGGVCGVCGLRVCRAGSPGQAGGCGTWPLLPLAGLEGLRGRAGSGLPGVQLRPRAALWPLRLKQHEVTVLATGRPVTLGPRSRPGFPGGGVAGSQPRCPS